MKVSEILEVIGNITGKLVISYPNKIIGIQDIIKHQDAEVDCLDTFSDGSLLVVLKNNKGGESNETT